MAVAFLLASCSFFSHSQPKVFSLDRVAPAAVTAVRGLPIAIGGVELPPDLDRREIVVRQADHQLLIRSNELWSASLQPLVLQTLASDLADRLPVGMMILPGAAQPAGALRTIDIVFEDLSAGPESRVVADARVTVHTSGQPDVTRREQIAIDIPSLDSANIATGMSRVIAALADRIAAGL